jgi:hypothetical protein
MKLRLAVILLFSTLSTYHAWGQKIEPLVKGGLTLGLFDGIAASDEDVFHVGLNIGAGVRLPINKSHTTFLEPTLGVISKGNVYDVSKGGGKVSFNLWYLEAQLDFVYRWQIGKRCYIPIGTGLYGAYGISSKISTTNGITWFRGIPVGESPSMFDSVIGANRWDAGWRVLTFGVEYGHLMFRWDFEVGFFSQFHNRMPYGIEKGKQYHGNNSAMSLNIGYCF